MLNFKWNYTKKHMSFTNFGPGNLYKTEHFYLHNLFCKGLFRFFSLLIDYFKIFADFLYLYFFFISFILIFLYTIWCLTFFNPFQLQRAAVFTAFAISKTSLLTSSPDEQLITAGKLIQTWRKKWLPHIATHLAYSLSMRMTFFLMVLRNKEC